MDIQERPATLAKGERSSRSWWPAQRRATQSRRAQGRERQEELFFSGKGDFWLLPKNGWVSEKECGGMKIGGGKMEKEEAGFKMGREEQLGCKPCKEETGRGTSGGRRPPGTSRCYIKKVHVCVPATRRRSKNCLFYLQGCLHVAWSWRQISVDLAPPAAREGFVDKQLCRLWTYNEIGTWTAVGFIWTRKHFASLKLWIWCL